MNEKDTIQKLDNILFSDKIFGLNGYYDIMKLYKNQSHIKGITFERVDEFYYKITEFKV